MFERLTDPALQAIVDARAVARRSRHRSVDAPHLLMGILRSADTAGAAVLTRAGLRHDDALAMLERVYDRVDDRLAARAALTRQAKKLLEYALDEARSDGHGRITTVHLTLACSRVDQLPAVKPFVADRDQAIRRHAFEALGRPVDPDWERAQQRRDALARANQTRKQRAQLKKDLKAGRRAIRQTLLDPPAYIATAKVSDILLALPRFGRVKVSTVLTRCRISPSKTIGGLSDRQRDELVWLVGR